MGFFVSNELVPGLNTSGTRGKKPEDEMNLAPTPLLPLNKAETLTSLGTSPLPDPRHCLQLFGKDQTHHFILNIPLRPAGKKRFIKEINKKYKEHLGTERR